MIDLPESEFPDWRSAVSNLRCTGLPTRAVNALANVGVRDLDDFRERDWERLKAELARTPNCGPATLAVIERWLPDPKVA